MSSTLDRLTVLGAGVLGGQIAWHSAFKGKTVVVYDPFPDALSNARAAHDHYAAIYASALGATEADLAATRARLTYATDVPEAVAAADLVIEAVPEVPEIKAEVYRTMAGLLPAPAPRPRRSRPSQPSPSRSARCRFPSAASRTATCSTLGSWRC